MKSNQKEIIGNWIKITAIIHITKLSIPLLLNFILKLIFEMFDLMRDIKKWHRSPCYIQKV